jgi:hypothetical protein
MFLAPKYPRTMSTGTMAKTTALPFPPIRFPTLSRILSRIPFFENFSSSWGEMGRKLKIMGTRITAMIIWAMHQKVQAMVIF